MTRSSSRGPENLEKNWASSGGCRAGPGRDAADCGLWRRRYLVPGSPAASCGGTPETKEAARAQEPEEEGQAAPARFNWHHGQPGIWRLNSSGSAGSCGGGVSAGANTSCGFAEAVASAYRESGGPVVRAYSPTTHQTYAMSCSGTNPVVCRGGNDASVYIY